MHAAEDNGTEAPSGTPYEVIDRSKRSTVLELHLERARTIIWDMGCCGSEIDNKASDIDIAGVHWLTSWKPITLYWGDWPFPGIATQK